MNTEKTKTKLRISLVVGGILVGGPLSQFAAAERCTVNPLGPRICVSWDLVGEPFEGLHFDVDDVGANATDPLVTLYSGALWNVRSENADLSEGNIGSITIDATVATDDFNLTLTNGANPGAATVGAIVLNDTTNWTGNSSIVGGSISGDLTSDLEVIQNVSGGGAADFKIGGDVASGSTITIPRMNSGDTLTISGQLLGTASLLITDESEGVMTIGGVTQNASITVERLTGGLLRFLGQEVAGTVTLKNGMPVGTDVFFYVPLSGTLDFNGGNVVGYLDCKFGVSGNIVNGGNVSGRSLGGGVALSQYVNDFTGTATFAAADQDSLIWVRPGTDLAGTIVIQNECDGLLQIGAAGISPSDITAGGSITVGSVGANGSILVWGDIEANADVIVTGANAGNIEIGSESFGLGEVKIGGSIDVGSVSSMGIIRTWGDVADGSTVSVDGDMAGQIHLQSDLLGALFVGGDMSGTAFHVHRTVKSTGKITIVGTLSAAVSIGAATEAGSLVSIGKITSTGSVIVDETLGGDGGDDFDASGDIEVHGAMSGLIDIRNRLLGSIVADGTESIGGDITVSEETGSLSVIYLACGSTSGSTITINDSEGNFNANGYIRMGGLGETCTIPNDPPYGYEGCIHVKDYWGFPPSGGVFVGNVDITLCHNTGDDAEMNAERGVTGTHILQNSCDTVGWTSATCP